MAHNMGIIDNCCFRGTIISPNGDSVGGIAGRGNVFKNCRVEGTISGWNDVGGIVGGAANPVNNCENFGDVNGAKWVGGIAGNTFYCGKTDGEGTVDKCINYGNVNASSSTAGGIVGDADYRVTGCKNYGKVTGEGSIGDIIGHQNSRTQLIGSSFGSGSWILVIVLTLIGALAMGVAVLLVKRNKRG